VQTHVTDASVAQPTDALSSVCCSSRTRQMRLRCLTPSPFATCLDHWSSPRSRSMRQTHLSQSSDTAFMPTDAVQKRLSRAGLSDVSVDTLTDVSVALRHVAPKSPKLQRTTDTTTVPCTASVTIMTPRLMARSRPPQNPMLGYGDRRCTVASNA
jgi:hypothetical protein